MPILMILDVEGGTVEQYDRVDELLGGVAEHAPPGLISHAAGLTDTGLLVADVWESAEDLQRFFDAKLGAAIAQAGVPETQPRIVPVHNHIDGSGDVGTALVLIELDGMTTADYDALTADLAAHAGDGNAHPSVSHVVGVTDNGLVVVDIWESADQFAEFGETELAPRMGPEAMAQMQPRFGKLHNHVQVKSPTVAS